MESQRTSCQLFRAFCFITEELLFSVDGLETFTLQPIWRRINPPFISSNLLRYSFIILVTNLGNSSTFKAFSCSNTQESLFYKIKKKLECFNVCWKTNNARFAKRKIHKIIHMMTIFFVWWAPSFSWLWWLTKRFFRESLCNFMREGFGFFDYWVTKNFVLYLWKEKCNDGWFQVPHEFCFEKLCLVYQH